MWLICLLFYIILDFICRKRMVMVFDCVYLLWCYCFWGEDDWWCFVKFLLDIEDDCVFLFFNLDKLFKVFGVDVVWEYMDLWLEGYIDFYFF